jgi:hypothetical protein
MSRTTLGLFGAARPRPVAQDRLIATSDTAADAYRAERMSGLTPVERALAEPKGSATPNPGSHPQPCSPDTP